MRWRGCDVDCQGINQRTYDSSERVAEIDAEAPDCACESCRMSKYSPGVVADSEQLAIFVFHPIQQIAKKTGRIKPNVFSHVRTRGRSIQRDDVAVNDEMVNFVTSFLAADKKRVWKGVLKGRCSVVRGIEADIREKRRAVCVYDTANPDNISHAELCQTQYVVDEADSVELRHELLTAFDGGVIHPAKQYRNGAVWNQLPADFQLRDS